jgi:hypothetical protein
MAVSTSFTCNRGKKIVLNERNKEVTKLKSNQDEPRSSFGRENSLPSATSHAHAAPDLAATGQWMDGEREDQDSIPHDLLMAAITKEIISKMKNPPPQSSGVKYND